MRAVERFWNDESGQGLPEYALLVAAVVVMVVAAAALFSAEILELFNDLSDYISTNSPV